MRSRHLTDTSKNLDAVAPNQAAWVQMPLKERVDALVYVRKTLMESIKSATEAVEGLGKDIRTQVDNGAKPKYILRFLGQFVAKFVIETA